LDVLNDGKHTVRVLDCSNSYLGTSIQGAVHINFNKKRGNIMKKAVNITFMVAGMLMFAEQAMAHANSDNPDLVHVCVNKTTKVLRIIEGEGECMANENPKHMGKIGPDGVIAAPKPKAPR
jgi:hypothetical protein